MEDPSLGRTVLSIVPSRNSLLLVSDPSRAFELTQRPLSALNLALHNLGQPNICLNNREKLHGGLWAKR